jgi:hypothetical protein
MFTFTLMFVTLEANKTTTLSSPPTYINTKLQEIINQKKSDSSVRLRGQNLTCADMEIVGYYLLLNNTVKNIFFIFILSGNERSIFYS